MKKIAKRGLALLLMLVMCLPLGLESADAADDTPLAGVDGVVDIWKWTKVKTQADLPDTRPTRTVGSSSETYDYALLLVYEFKGKKYFANAEYSNRRANRGFTMKERFWLAAASLDGMAGVDSSLDTFRTRENIGHMYLRPTGKKDSDNGNCKIYNLYADDNSSPLYLMYGDKYIEENGWKTDRTRAYGLCFSDSPFDKYCNLSFCTNDSEPDHVTKGTVKIFANISNSYDYCLWPDYEGDISCGTMGGALDMWDFPAFDVYVGVKEQWSAIRSNYTIKSGMVANYNGYIYIEPNVTITVEEGGVLSSSGVLYNNGTIRNEGGTVLVQPNATIEQFCLGDSPGGNLYCDRGDLVILSGGRVTATTLLMRRGATLTNFGALAASGGMISLYEGATIDNRSSGAVFFGVTPKSRYAGNFSSLTSDGAGSRDVYDVKPAYYMGLTPVPCRIFVGSDVMLYNEGRVYSAGYMYKDGYYSGYDSRYIGAKNITCKGSGKLYMYESVKKINDALGYTSCLSEWSSMYSVLSGA